MTALTIPTRCPRCGKWRPPRTLRTPRRYAPRWGRPSAILNAAIQLSPDGNGLSGSPNGGLIEAAAGELCCCQRSPCTICPKQPQALVVNFPGLLLNTFDNPAGSGALGFVSPDDVFAGSFAYVQSGSLQGPYILCPTATDTPSVVIVHPFTPCDWYGYFKDQASIAVDADDLGNPAFGVTADLEIVVRVTLSGVLKHIEVFAWLWGHWPSAISTSSGRYFFFPYFQTFSGFTNWDTRTEEIDCYAMTDGSHTIANTGIGGLATLSGQDNTTCPDVVLCLPPSCGLNYLVTFKKPGRANIGVTVTWDASFGEYRGIWSDGLGAAALVHLKCFPGRNLFIDVSTPSGSTPGPDTFERFFANGTDDFSFCLNAGSWTCVTVGSDNTVTVEEA